MIRIAPKNTPTSERDTWTEDGLTFTELCRQEYGGNGAYWATGVVEGHPVEDCYLQFGKDGEPTGMFLLINDELAAIAWVATGALWSILLAQRTEAQGG